LRVSKAALIVIDMIHSYDFPDAEKLIPSVEETLPAMREAIDRARSDGVVTIYVNDNYGKWRSSSDELVEQALESPHRDLVEPIAPHEDALFVVKTRHSIFYSTPLEYLLRHENVDSVTLTGQVTEQCVLYSALDAYIRHFALRVPPDAVAHIYPELAEAALKMMERNMRADLSPVRG
jgi:nicotinamidase-related amidase